MLAAIQRDAALVSPFKGEFAHLASSAGRLRLLDPSAGRVLS